jgi:hypothetical protein
VTGEPTPAEQARAALARATVATLVTPGCPSAPATTVVSVEVGAEGQPFLWLEEGAPIVRALWDGKVVSLVLPAPVPFESLKVTGPLRHRRTSRPGRRGYRLTPLSVRLVGTATLSIPVSELLATAAGVEEQAYAVLQHLERAHAAELLACVRAHGFHDALAVVPSQLDRHGLTLAVIGADGVRVLQLPFPGGPVDRVEDVALGLRTTLTCRCRAGTR